MRPIYMAYGDRPREMTLGLLTASDTASFVPQGASIGIKPNLVVADSPERGATTHTEIVAGLIEYLMEHGFRDISIMESSWVGEGTGRAFSLLGYHEMAKRFGVKLYDLKKDKTRTLSTPAGDMKVCTRPLDTDFLISLPVLKGHCQTVMTCALKNSKGCIPDSEKRRFHSLGLHRPIAALATVLKPRLILVDSICGDLNFEEGGTPVQTKRMMLGADPVQIDSFGCRLMGIDPKEVSYIGLAAQWKAGELFTEDDPVIPVNDPGGAPAYPKPSGLVSRLTKNVRQDKACSACFGNLVHALYRLDRKPTEPIRIGQGFQGQRFEGIGIGRCCSGASCTVPGCPPSALDILKALRKR